MKRIIKFLFSLSMALVAVVITFAIIFFITPSWQKGLVDRGLARDTGRQWLVDSVRIRPTNVQVANLQVLEGAIGAKIEMAALSGPFWKSPVANVLDLKAFDVGDLTSREWKILSAQVGEDEELWTERINLVLSKLGASGWTIHVNNLEVDGIILMPNEEQIPVRWLIVEADTRDLSKTRIEPARSSTGTEL